MTTLYDEYCQLRLECGFDAGHEIKPAVWNACDRESQMSMVAQMRRGAAQHKQQMETERQYKERYGEVW